MFTTPDGGRYKFESWRDGIMPAYRVGGSLYPVRYRYINVNHSMDVMNQIMST